MRCMIMSIIHHTTFRTETASGNQLPNRVAAGGLTSGHPLKIVQRPNRYERPCQLPARLMVETDEHRSLIDRLSFGHDRICREAFIRPAQSDAFHDDLIIGYSGVLTHHR